MDGLTRLSGTRRGLQMLLIGSVVSALLALGAPTAPLGAASSAKPQRGGNFTWIGADPGSFDPARMGNFSTAGALGYPVYDGLLYLDPVTAEPRGLLLQSITGTPDGASWTMKLRPKVTFTDGTPWNSAALKANFDYASANPTHQGRSFADAIATWDISDPMVAKVTLKTPSVVFPLDLITRMTLMASPTALAKYGSRYGTSPDTIVGAGPFTLTSWVRGSQMVFTRNPNYWDAPKPYLETVTIQVIADPTSAFNTVTTGGADAMASPSAAMEEQAKSAGMKLEQYYANLVTFHPIYFMNLARPPFNDLVARQAVYACLDPKKVAAASGRPLATAEFDQSSPWYSPNGIFPKFDAKKCQRLIDEWSAKNGNAPLTFTVTDVIGNTIQGGQGETIQAAFSGYQNVKVNVQQVTQAQVTALAASGNFDLYPTATGGVDPSQAFDTAYLSNGSRNFGKYANPAMDAAINAGHSTTNMAQRKKAYDTVQKILMTDLPTWFMPIVGFSPNHFIVSNKSVQDWGGGQWTGPLTAQIWLKRK